MSLYKDVFQKEQHSDCSLKKHHQKEPRSFRSHIKEFGYSSQLCLSQSAEIIYKKVMSYEHIARNKKLITFHKSRFANMSLSSLANQSSSPKSRHLTIQEKVLVVARLKSSGEAYRILAKIFGFSSKHACLELIKHIPMRAGLNEQIFLSLKSTVQDMMLQDRFCIMMFDKIKVAPNLQYNVKEDYINGLVSQWSYNKGAMADYANKCFYGEGIILKMETTYLLHVFKWSN
ncbi:hypothetical protein GWI33_001669 [Rhynchophorus ferrugineus]|uniref:Transposable element P transposase-like RNase H domain-containing protein n=1 Tax=Rhynchophorus ferrugineus TaxID=354439 RepID=A0A834IU82_RHYFE|nr:hypothetical protein GWI33_001669 [Rhynchophorus ferrugineus]